MIMYDKEKGITQVIGCITGQPAFITDEHGNKELSFDVARTDKWTDRETGEKKEVTHIHHCVIKGSKAEAAGKYLSSGVNVFVEGAQTSSKDKTALNVSMFYLLAAHKS